MKRIKMNRRDFIKGSAFITGSAAGAGLLVGNNPELEAAPATPEAASATRTTTSTPGSPLRPDSGVRRRPSAPCAGGPLRGSPVTCRNLPCEPDLRAVG